MGDENPIRTLGDYSKPSHEGYRNTIELSVGNNVVPLRSDTIRLVQNRCSFHRLRSKDPIQHLKDFLKLVDSLDLDGDNRKRTLVPMTLNIAWKTSNMPLLTTHPRVPIKRETSKFEADFKQHQSEMTNKIDTVLKAITDRIAGALPSDTFKNPKLSVSSVLSARSYPITDPQCSTQIHGSINAITDQPKQQSDSHNDKTEENEEEEKDSPENTQSTPLDPSVSFITKKVLNSIHSSNRSDWFPHRPMLNSFTPKRKMAIKLDPSENSSVGVSSFTWRIKGMHVFVGNFTYVVDFMTVEGISSIINLRLSQVVLGKPFIEISNMTHDPSEGVVRFTNGNDEVAYKMPHKIEQYNSLSNLEKEHTKSVYLRSDEDKRKGVECVMSKILRFYKKCLELGPEYLTGVDDEGEVT
uniref:Retrotransposon Orf1 n=1 Tax=Tanacetum cinerariifolium TaxID=118510 RepID=A0A6L2KJM9_TANCI|nr:retrotransposon Orf1 [Tanacetum cinerariifolium]